MNINSLKNKKQNGANFTDSSILNSTTSTKSALQRSHEYTHTEESVVKLSAPITHTHHSQ